jgi:predicted nucleotide-binding protein
MDVGLFLDVDNTLTVGLVQQQYASLLGVDSEHKLLEDAWISGQINTDEFGRRLIELFNTAGFTEDKSEEFYHNIRLHEWTDDLLRSPATKYLVSSGPSYFVKKLAVKYEIPSENVLCSEYEFGSDRRLSSCRGISPRQKQLFVIERVNRHVITIGVGDHPAHDAFVSVCDLPVLTVNAHGFLHVESLESIVTLIPRISRHQITVPRTKPALFLGCSAERLSLAESLHAQLDRACDPTIWKDGVFTPSSTNIESLEKSLSDFDFAVFLMTPDDIVLIRGEQHAAARDNLIFELGLFLGRLGRERCLIVHPRGEKPKLPSDIEGIVMLDYPNDRIMTNPDAALAGCVAQIKKRVQTLGSRGFRL